MIRRPPKSTRTGTLFPYTTLFRSGDVVEHVSLDHLGDGGGPAAQPRRVGPQVAPVGLDGGRGPPPLGRQPHEQVLDLEREVVAVGGARRFDHTRRAVSSEERRVGKECVSTCRSRWSQYH